MNFIRIISLSIILFCSGLNAQIKEKSIESVDLKSTKKKLKKKKILLTKFCRKFGNVKKATD